MIDVLIIGAGATGLFAAGAFARAGLEVEVWEKRNERALLSRAIGVHAPALAALERVGAAEPLIDEAVRVRRGHARVAPLIGTAVRPRHVGTVSFDGVSRRFPFVATLPQHRTEALLEEVLRTIGTAPVRYGLDVVGVAPDPRGVTVRGEGTGTARTGTQTQQRARFVVIADGTESPARRRLGVRTSGRSYRDRYLMGDVADTTDDGEDAVVTLTPDGVVESFPLPGGVRRFVAHTPVLLPHAGADVLARLVATRTGITVDPASATLVSAFGVRRSLAERFAVGTRIAIVGDAAHEISPIGGQGMNLGWLDVAALVPVVVALLDGSASSDRLEAWDRTRRTAAVAAARQAEVNMALSAPGTSIGIRARAAVLSRVLRGTGGSRLGRVYAMGGD
ncbi:FAD-dependent monooxygenase [Labedella populi]|uniref:FAD-dependent monooxygenase n=1 Tax=Labedella populi TaxID=2498850 RepID=A0A444Q5X9_9MICO|nr:NAD(P)/FAD-dependent oxidoreductase [Labedella populi]RWZ59174.1 FAD-dependent monooxygenase [Labedella populi]